MASGLLLAAVAAAWAPLAHSLAVRELPNVQPSAFTLPVRWRDWGASLLRHAKTGECHSKVKLVVNSHVKYGKVLPAFFASLERSGFRRFEDVVVFRGGAPRNTKPETDARGVTFVNLTIDAFDLNALSGLHRHMDDPRVCAGAYLYVHDTVGFDASFPGHFAELEALAPGEARLSPRPNSNTVAFGRGVLERYGSTYDVNLSKLEGVALEFGGSPRGVRPVESFASKVSMQRDRVQVGVVDRYHTGYPRVKFYYPDLGIYKYAMAGVSGDISGNVRSIATTLLDASRAPPADPA